MLTLVDAHRVIREIQTDDLDSQVLFQQADQDRVRALFSSARFDNDDVWACFTNPLDGSIHIRFAPDQFHISFLVEERLNATTKERMAGKQENASHLAHPRVEIKNLSTSPVERPAFPPSEMPR